ncbi:MAG: hypothetical protein M0010_18525, partial [Actinomycetota bacterium]|nr:hypothetical protein [Actinomycetota bacterium]
MSSIRVHFMETGSDGVPVAEAVCRRVPSWATRSTNLADVTCSWCLRWLRKHRGEEHPVGSRLRVQRDAAPMFSIYRVERGGRFIGRVALLTTRRWSATGPAADVLGEHFARRRDAVDALVRH